MAALPPSFQPWNAAIRTGERSAGLDSQSTRELYAVRGRYSPAASASAASTAIAAAASVWVERAAGERSHALRGGLALARADAGVRGRGGEHVGGGDDACGDRDGLAGEPVRVAGAVVAFVVVADGVGGRRQLRDAADEVGAEPDVGAHQRRVDVAGRIRRRERVVGQGDHPDVVQPGGDGAPGGGRFVEPGVRGDRARDRGHPLDAGRRVALAGAGDQRDGARDVLGTTVDDEAQVR